MINNPTPKAEFLSDANKVAAHKSLIARDDFRLSLATAQRAYTRALCDIAPGNMAEQNYSQASAAAFNRLQGMSDFCAVLLNLAENPPPPIRSTLSQNLDQKGAN